MAIEIYMGDVPEQSTSTVTVTFRDADGNLVVPTNVKYRLDCVTTGTAIKAETSVTPGSSVEITVTSAENSIQDQDNAYEVKELTIVADDGLPTECHESAKWRVRNLSFVS